MNLRLSRVVSLQAKTNKISPLKKLFFSEEFRKICIYTEKETLEKTKGR
jgi:hypothetical protein